MSKLSKNIIVNVFGRILVVLASFIAVKLIFRQLGSDALGILMLTLTLSTLLVGLLDAGIWATTAREISKHNGDEPQYIDELLRTCSLICWVCYAAASALFYFAAPLVVAHWVQLSDLDKPTAVWMFRVLGISGLLALPRAFYLSLFQGLEKLELSNAIDIAISILQQLGAALILAGGGGLRAVTQWYALSYLMAVSCYFSLAAHNFSLRSLMPGFSIEVLKRNVAFMLPMSGLSILSMIHTQTDKIFTSKFLPIAAFSYYGFASSIVARASLVIASIGQASFPSLVGALFRHDKSVAVAKYHKLQDLICFGTMPIFAGIVYITLPLYSYVFNAQVARLMEWPVILLCVGQFLNGAMVIPSLFPVAQGKPAVVVKFALLALLVVTVPAFFVVRTFGLIGASLVWVFYNFFGCVYLAPKVCKQSLELPLMGWYSHLIKVIGLALGTYGAGWMVLHVMTAGAWHQVAIGYIVASVAFAAGAFRLASSELRGALQGMSFSLAGLRKRSIRI